MNACNKNGCRGKGVLSTISTKLLIQPDHKLILSKISILLFLPALFSCGDMKEVILNEDKMETMICVRSPGETYGGSGIDIFTFESTGAGHLDSYQHISSLDGSSIGIRSQKGTKHVFICMNGQRTMHDWSGINSLESLGETYIELKNERRNALCATSEGMIEAGTKSPGRFEMRKIASEIVLNSISCDFTGKAYAGKTITDVKVYLTNVNARCSLTADGAVSPSGIVNAGKADHGDMEEFAEPDLLFQEMEDNIDDTPSDAGLSFICYPNSSQAEGPGTPFTRLVIEGRIDGQTYWWPIVINRGEDAEMPGIHRNSRYVFDIKITRKGASSPDGDIETEAVKAVMNIRPWNEKEEQEEIF